MTLFYFVSLLALPSIITADHGHKALLEEELASSPLIRRLLERVDILEKHHTKQQQEIQSLKTMVVQQRVDMIKMNSKQKAKDKTIQSLLHKLGQSDYYRKSTGEQSKNANLHRTSKAAYTNERDVPNRIRRAENEVIAAFAAGLTQHMTQVGDKQNIKFDKVITNVGNTYNPHVGVFIAPVTGIYVFSTSILSYDSRSNWAYLVVNNVPQTSLYMHDDSHAMSSHTLVFQLNKGDDVSVQGHTGSAYQGTSIPYTTFSGFLLQQIYTNGGNIIG